MVWKKINVITTNTCEENWIRVRESFYVHFPVFSILLCHLNRYIFLHFNRWNFHREFSQNELFALFMEFLGAIWVRKHKKRESSIPNYEPMVCIKAMRQPFGILMRGNLFNLFLLWMALHLHNNNKIFRRDCAYIVVACTKCMETTEI